MFQGFWDDEIGRRLIFLMGKYQKNREVSAFLGDNCTEVFSGKSTERTQNPRSVTGGEDILAKQGKRSLQRPVLCWWYCLGENIMILKCTRGKCFITLKSSPIRLTEDFSSEILQDSREWKYTVYILKEKKSVSPGYYTQWSSHS